MKRLSWTLIAGLACALLATASPAQKKKAPQRRAPAPRVILKAEEINRPTQAMVGPKSSGAAAIRAQILLARAHFSPGEIELSYNDNLKAALAAFQTARGLEPSGVADAETWAALEGASGPASGEAALTQGLDDGAASSDAQRAASPNLAPNSAVLAEYEITKEDTAGPFTKIPRARNAEELMLKKEQLPNLGYTSVLERLGEKFHINPRLLAQLNPGKNFSRAGEKILAPSLPPPLEERANLVVVDESDHGVTALSADGRVLAFYPATMGSQHDPLPVGNWKINGVSRLPKFHYDPRLFWDAQNKNAHAVLPPGPNSPVGTVWIDLSKEHYGIHGTPEPSLIGKTESHGCIRLTNWDVEELARMVGPGVPAVLQE